MSLLGCASCTHLLKPKTPALIAACPYTPEQFKQDLDAYHAAMPNDGNARPIRDRMVNNLICVIDDVFGQYEITFLRGRSAASITGEGLQAGLAASATAVNGARGKTIISAFLAGVTGLDLSIDKNLFAQQTFQAIASSMEARRNRILQTILKRLANESTATYPFEAARADLTQFFYAGTLAGGLQELNSQTGTQATQSEQKLQAQMVANATKQDVADATALNRAIRQALSGNPPSAPEKVRAFLRALGETDVDNMTPDQLLETYQTKYSDKIVQDLAYRKLAFDAARGVGLIP